MDKNDVNLRMVNLAVNDALEIFQEVERVSQVQSHEQMGNVWEVLRSH